MTTIAPLQEQIVEMSREDLELLQKKIARYRKTPLYLRIIAPAVLGLITWLVYEFLEITDMYLLFVGGYVALYILTEWALAKFFRDLKREIKTGTKLIWTGTLTEAFRRKGPNNGNTGRNGYIWNVSGREFVLEKEEFTAAKVGEFVKLEQLPDSEVVLRAERLT